MTDPVDSIPWESRVRHQVEQLRLHAEARETFEAEQHALRWRVPVSRGSLTEEMALPVLGPQWRIQGLLRSQGNALLVATRKAGKTVMTINLIRSLTGGDPFLGEFRCEPVDGGIALFNYELPTDQYIEWCRSADIPNTDQVFALHLRGNVMPISNPRVRAWIVTWLKERQVRVWVIDPYARAALGIVGAENDNGQVSVFTDLLDQIKMEAGVEEIILPTHTAKGKVESGAESARGGGRLEDWADALWYLTKDEQGGRYFRADGRDVLSAEGTLTYDPADRRLGLRTGDRKQAKLDAGLVELTMALQAGPGSTANSLRGILGCSDSTVKALIGKAGDRVRAEVRGRATYYFLA